MAHSHPFPDDLVLTPVSRAPVRLPQATLDLVATLPLVPKLAWAPNSDIGTIQPRASVVVVTFNNLAFTKLCLTSLLANTEGPPFELIVVDNASEDGTPAYLVGLARTMPHVRVILNSDNRGFAPANNQGLALATGDVLVLLNNDTIVPPGWLSGLVRHLFDRNVGTVGPVTNRIGNEARIETSYRTYGELERFVVAHTQAHVGEVFDIGTATMFCLALRRDVFEAVGPLDEQFEVGLLEDDDYSRRLRAAGYRVICAEDVFVHHFEKASFGQLISSGRYSELLRRNQERFAAKWGEPWKPYRRRPSPHYRGLVARIRELVSQAVPSDATVVVVSKGDEHLLDLDGRQTWHFPQAEDGAYAGHYPADSAAAIRHLESLRMKGANFLLLPSTAFWWLDFYREFARHLKRHYRAVIQEDDACQIFTLAGTRQAHSRIARTHEALNVRSE